MSAIRYVVRESYLGNFNVYKVKVSKDWFSRTSEYVSIGTAYDLMEAERLIKSHAATDGELVVKYYNKFGDEDTSW